MPNPRDTQEPQTPIATKEAKHGVIIVDACDADLLCKSYTIRPSTSKTFYVLIYTGRLESVSRTRTRLIHRAVLERAIGRSLLTSEQVDHINGNGLDNRRVNLRMATSSKNQANTKLRKNNTSGFKGVSWNKGNNKWIATITMNNISTYLGYFTNPAEAHDAYMRAAVAYFGEFANSGKTGQLDLFATNEDDL